VKEAEITPGRYMPATVVRVTPRGGDGSHDHAWALAYHFAEPVVFGVGALETVPGWTLGPEAPVCASMFGHRMAAALVAPWRHPEHRDVSAVAQSIWQQRRTHCAVEAWGTIGAGRWWYMLVPCWRRIDDTELWPLKGAPEHQVYALGECRRVDAYAWPDPPPLPGPHPVDRGTQAVYGETHVPPPPAGFPPRPGAAR
jgi:hypothetical protein